jgi:hypothetical protein
MVGKRAQRGGRHRAVPSLALSLVAGVGLAWGVAHLGSQAGHGTAAHEPTAAISSPASTSAAPQLPASPVTPAHRVGARPEAPAQVRLPSGTTVPVLAVSTRTDGVLDVPENIRTAGWWRGGSRIGDPFGATLIAAHIDSRTQGLGPYAELLSVQPRARIVVRTAHLVQTFRVTSLRLVPRTRLAEASDIYAASGPRRLTMVTCAGPYDPDRGGYQNLAVVTARPTGSPEPRSPHP